MSLGRPNQRPIRPAACTSRGRGKVRPGIDAYNLGHRCRNHPLIVVTIHFGYFFSERPPIKSAEETPP